MSLIDRVNHLVALGAGDANDHESNAAARLACKLMRQHGLRVTDAFSASSPAAPSSPPPPPGSPLVDLFKRAMDVGADIMREAVVNDQKERARRRVEDAVSEDELSRFAFDLAQAPVSAAREARRAASSGRPAGVTPTEAQFVRAYFRLEHEVLAIAADLYRRAGDDAKAQKLERELEDVSRAEKVMRGRGRR